MTELSKRAKLRLERGIRTLGEIRDALKVERPELTSRERASLTMKIHEQEEAAHREQALTKFLLEGGIPQGKLVINKPLANHEAEAIRQDIIQKRAEGLLDGEIIENRKLYIKKYSKN